MRIFYHSFVDPKDGLFRTIVVAYTRDLSTKEISYGASVFKKESSSETLKKSLLRNTASERFKKRPVKFISSKDENVHISKVEEEIISHIKCNNYLVRSRERRTEVKEATI